MHRQTFLRVAMTLETEGVKLRLHTNLQVASTAFVTQDAVLEASAIREVMVAGQAIDIHVLGMGKVKCQGTRA